MEKNEQETLRTLFSFNLVLTKSCYNIRVASICENNKGDSKKGGLFQIKISNKQKQSMYSNFENNEEYIF